MADNNKPTLEYELNDNVVAKLRNLVGGGGNSLVSIDDLIDVVRNKRIDVDKLIQFVAAKDPDHYSDVYSLSIPNVIDVTSSDIYVYGYYVTNFSGWASIEAITNCKTEIEAATGTPSRSGDTVVYVDNHDSSSIDVRLQGYTILALVLDTYVYPLTLDDLDAFLVPTNA